MIRLPGNPAAWLSAIVHSAEDAILGRSLSGDVVSWNPAAERMFGYPAEEILGQPISLLADPASPDETAHLTDRVINGERITAYETTRKRKDGSVIPVSLTLSLVRNDAGGVIGTSKFLRDITARKQREDHIRLLAADLEHRTRNLLTLVDAQVRQTQADTVAEFREAVAGRVTALAAVNEALGRTNWRSASLKILTRDGVRAFAVRENAIVLQGPDLSLSPMAAQTWAMVLHELGTNALKHGALGNDGGAIKLTWNLAAPGLRLRWRETGGPAVEPPTREGLGLKVLRSGIEGQLGGALHLNWAATGFTCEMALPIAHVVNDDR